MDLSCNRFITNKYTVLFLYSHHQEQILCADILYQFKNKQKKQTKQKTHFTQNKLNPIIFGLWHSTRQRVQWNSPAHGHNEVGRHDSG